MNSPAVVAVCARHQLDDGITQDTICSFLDAPWTWTLNAAALRGCYHLVVRLHHRYPVPFDHCNSDAMDTAAEFGHTRVVQFLHENRIEGCSSDAMDLAASNGHLDTVKYLHEHRSEGCTTNAMDMASAGGHLQVLKWLQRHRNEGCTVDAMASAAANGHLDVMNWLYHVKKLPITSLVLKLASTRGNTKVVHWALHRADLGEINDALVYSFYSSKLDVVRLLESYREERMKGLYAEREDVPNIYLNL